jgi:hypothetical protein
LITVIRKEAARRDFVAFDLEWHPKSLDLRLIGLFDGQRYRSWDAERHGPERAVAGFMREVLTNRYEKKWIFAHWGGATDLCFFLAFFLEHGFSVDLRFSGSSAVFCEVRRGRRKWRFCDSFFLLRAPLRKVMAKIGMKKGGAEGDDEIFIAKMSELRAYNENDCRGLYVALDRFQDRILAMGGEMRPTIASTGMNLFRRKYLSSDILTDDAYNRIARQAYVASRVEVFKKHATERNQYDINSSFPSSMTLTAPGGFLEAQSRVPREGDLFFADVTFAVPEMMFPPVPKRAGGKVFFPTGTWRQWLTGRDFRVVEKLGKVDRVHEVLVYGGREDMRAYVEDIYEHRKASTDEFDREIDKLLMNALYGKFAERTEKSVIILNGTESVESMRERGLDAEELFPGAVRVDEERAIPHEHVPFAAHVTACSREKILDLLLLAGDAEYTDSVSARRPVVVRSPEGRTKIVPIEDLWKLATNVTVRGEKEIAELPGWSALARKYDVDGWFPLRQIIRHRAQKEMWRIETKRGATEVTSDHGIMVCGLALRPETFLVERHRFDVVRAPKPVPRDVDLFEYVRDFSYEVEGVGTRSFEADGKWVVLPYIGNWAKRGLPPQRFRRFYRPGSNELRALLRLVGAFVAEGSCSISGKAVRSLWSICNQEVPWLEGLGKDLASLVENCPARVFPATKQGVHALRSGALFLSALFGCLCGSEGSAGRRLPDFAYDLSDGDFDALWRALRFGDGSKDAAGQWSYTTVSQELAAGLSYLLDQHDIEHGFLYRPSKKSWALRTRPEGSERKRWTDYVERRQAGPDEWVYDLSVEGAHTFVDAVGRVLLHNTDSVTTSTVLPCSPELGALKHEKIVHEGIYHAAKFYLTDATDMATGERSITVKAKGFSKILDASTGKQRKLAREDFEALLAGQSVRVDRMARPREMLRGAGAADGRKLDPRVLEIKKRLQTYEEKRCFSADGQTSRPWTVKELLERYGPG